MDRPVFTRFDAVICACFTRFSATICNNRATISNSGTHCSADKTTPPRFGEDFTAAHPTSLPCEEASPEFGEVGRRFRQSSPGSAEVD